jgi:hypothetical protein
MTIDRNMTIRWAEHEGDGLQQVVLSPVGEGISMHGMALVSSPQAVAVRFHLTAGADWIVRTLTLERLGFEAMIRLAHDGAGHWTLDGQPAPDLDGALEPDISISPLTNTLPVRRLGLAEGESRDIRTAYVDVDTMRVRADGQRYTCLVPDRYYRYESLDGDFVRDIEFGPDGFVETYPGLFRRVPLGA